jgi:hypothetical protein
MEKPAEIPELETRLVEEGGPDVKGDPPPDRTPGAVVEARGI